MGMSNAQVGEIARQLGHEHVQLERKGNRWGCSCSCGWVAREFYWTVDPAVAEGQYHLRKAVKDHLDKIRRDGRVFPLSQVAGL